MGRSAVFGRGLAWLARGTGPAPLPVWIALAFGAVIALGAVVWRPDPPPVTVNDLAGLKRPPKPAEPSPPEATGPSPQPGWRPPPAPNPPPVTKPYPKPSKLGPVTRLKTRTMHVWAGYEEGQNPRSYQVGQVKLTFSSDGDTAEELQKGEGLRVTFRAPGVKPDILYSPDARHRADFGVGRLDPKRPEPQILIVANTGGFHCCMNLILVSPHRGKWRIEPLIALDGDGFDWPKDSDGDGAPEIVTYDNRFLYAFCGYACSLPPPIVYQIENGAIVDVSNRRAFRKLFEKALPELTARCREHENAACASMVAVASRLGRRKQAWKIMLESYDPKDHHWGFPSWCRIDAGVDDCPKDKLERYADFPAALAAFLKHNDYR